MSTSEVSAAPSVLALSLSLYPSISRFALDVVRNQPDATAFCRRARLDSMEPPGEGRGTDALAAALDAANREWGNEVSAEIDRWRSGQSITLVAGQQVGFAGGPLYTLAKIASLLRMKRDFESRGIPATAMFWMATEDHDFQEVAKLDLPGPEGTIHLRGRPYRPGRDVIGGEAVPLNLIADLSTALGLAGEEWLKPGITFRDSFARLIAKVTGGRSLILVDSLLPELRRAGSDLLLALASDLEEAEAQIARRSEEIERAGYRAQVTTGEHGHYALLFEVEPGGRRVLLAPENRARAVELATSRPEALSTGALARPLLQDRVLRPDVFLGGPAEVSYYAQLAGLCERLHVHQPHVALRGHVLVAPSRFLSSLERYGVEASELFDPVDEIVLRHETDAIERLSAVIEEMGRSFDAQFDRVRDMVLPADRSLEKSLERTARRVRYHHGKLEQRGRRALARRDRERHQAIARLSRTLLPDGVPQDRIIGWIGWWAVWGERLLPGLVEAVRPDTDQLTIAGF